MRGIRLRATKRTLPRHPVATWKPRRRLDCLHHHMEVAVFCAFVGIYLNRFLYREPQDLRRPPSIRLDLELTGAAPGDQCSTHDEKRRRVLGHDVEWRECSGGNNVVLADSRAPSLC